MAITNFKDRIENLTGYDASSPQGAMPDDAAVQQFILEGCYDVIRKAGNIPGEIHRFVAKAGPWDAPGELPSNLDTTYKEIVSVTRGTADFQKECRRVTEKVADYLDAATSVYQAHASSPSYYIKDNTLVIKPDPAGTSGICYVYYIPGSYTISNWDSSTTAIANFPDKYFDHLVVYAAIKVLHYKLTHIQGDVPVKPSIIDVPILSLPDVPVIDDIDISTVLPVVPESILNTSLIPQGPEYFQPALNMPTTPTIEDISITLQAPTPPVLVGDASISYDNLTPPVWTAPPFPALDFTDADVWINTEEDGDMLSARISVINAQLNEYSNRLTASEKEYTQLKDEWDKAIAAVDKTYDRQSETDTKAQTQFTNDMTNYQNQVQTQMQEFKENVNKTIQIWQQECQNALQEYTQDITNSLNVFNTEFQKHQLTVQNAQKNTDLEEAKLQRDFQNFANQMQIYQQDVNTIVQKYQTDLGKDMKLWEGESNLAIQEYQAKLSAANTQHTSEMQIYQAEMGKHNQFYQWAQSQLAYLKQEYLEMFGIPQQGAQAQQ
jgi:hypothetical protein